MNVGARTLGKGGLAVVQVDGLSQTHLKRALDEGLMPHLKERLDQGTLQMDFYRSGLPSQTAVAIGGLLYGQMLPGNQWYDKEQQKVVDTFSFDGSLQAVSLLEKRGTGIASEGSVYLSPFDGGAKGNAAYYVYSDQARVAKSEGTKGVLRTAVSEFTGLMRHLLVHPLKAAQSAVHFASELTHDFRNKKMTGRSLKTIVGDSFKETFLADAASHKIAHQIGQGDENYLYVDLANFDAKNHTYGPGKEAFDTLPQVDKNLDVILDAVETSEHEYDIAILADHGSARAYHFSDLYGQSLNGLAQSLSPGRDVLSLDFGSGAHIYLKDDQRQLSRSELPPKLVSGLVNSDGIAFTVSREGKSTLIEGKDGQVRISGPKIEVQGKNPIQDFDSQTEVVARQLHDLCQREHSGDVMVFGEKHKDGLVDFSEGKFRGLHGGIGGDQAKPFVAWSSGLALRPQETRDAAGLQRQMFQSLKER